MNPNFNIGQAPNFNDNQFTYDDTFELSQAQLAARARGITYGPETHDPEAVEFLDEIFTKVIIEENPSDTAYKYPNLRWKDDGVQGEPNSFSQDINEVEGDVDFITLNTDLSSTKSSRLSQIMSWWRTEKPIVKQELTQSAEALREMSDYLKRDALMVSDDESVADIIVAMPPFLYEHLKNGTKKTIQAYKNIGVGIAESAANAIDNHPDVVKNIRRVGAPILASAILVSGVVSNPDASQTQPSANATEQSIGNLPIIRTAQYTEITIPELAIGQDYNKSKVDASSASGIPIGEIEIIGTTLRLPKDVTPNIATSAIVGALAPDDSESGLDQTTTTIVADSTVAESTTTIPETKKSPESMTDEEYIDWLAGHVKVSAADYAGFDVDTSREDAFKSELPGIKIKPTRFVGHWTAGLYKNGVDQFITSIKNRDGNCCSVMYFMDRNGKVYRLTDSNEKTAHAKNANSNSQGVEIEARGLKDYTPEQMRAFVMLAYRFMDANGIPIERNNFIGHSELGTGKPDMPAALVDRLFPKLQELAREVEGSKVEKPKAEPGATREKSELSQDAEKIISTLNLPEKQKDFLRKMLPVITETYINGAQINPTVVLAQATLESGFGSSELSSQANNYFGIKAGKNWKGQVYRISTKEEYTMDDVVTIRDDFRKYKNLEECIADYVQKIQSSSHYTDAVLNYESVEGYVNGLFNDVDDKGNIIHEQGEPGVLSYGTDRGYEEKVFNVIEKYGYQQLVNAQLGPEQNKSDILPVHNKQPSNVTQVPEPTKSEKLASNTATTTTTQKLEDKAVEKSEYTGTALSKDSAMKAYSVWFPDDEEGLKAWVDKLPVNKDGTVQVSIYNIPEYKVGDK